MSSVTFDQLGGVTHKRNTLQLVEGWYVMSRAGRLVGCEIAMRSMVPDILVAPHFLSLIAMRGWQVAILEEKTKLLDSKVRSYRKRVQI